MARVKYDDYVNYLKNLAQKHSDIKDALRWNPSEFQGDIKSGVSYPVMLVDAPDISPNGGDSSKLIDLHNSAINILLKPNLKDFSSPYNAQDAVLSEAYDIIQDVKERIFHDSKEPLLNSSDNFLYGMLDESSLEIVKIGPLFSEGLFGYRLEVSVKSTMSGLSRKEKWTDL